MYASLFVDSIALVLVDRVALLAVVGRALLVVLCPAHLVALWLQEAITSVCCGSLQLAILSWGGKGVRDTSSQLGQKAAYDNHLEKK